MNGHVICTNCLVDIKKGTNKCPVCCVAYRDEAIRTLYEEKVIEYLQMCIVRPYALLWLEYACKRLCAPGGKWAERDSAAFEKEFI